MKQRKLVAFILCCLLLLSAAVAAVAATPSQFFSLKSGDTEIVIEHNGIDGERLNALAQTMLSGVTTASAPNPWCIINGHDLEYLSATITRHKVYATQPRCVQELHKVSSCKRCDYTKDELLGTTLIWCCQ